MGVPTEPIHLGAWIEHQAEDCGLARTMASEDVLDASAHQFEDRAVCKDDLDGRVSAWTVPSAAEVGSYFSGDVGSYLEACHGDPARSIPPAPPADEDIVRQFCMRVEQEKSRMAGEIHDGMLQAIIGADMLLQGSVLLTPQQMRQRIESVRDTIRDAIGRGRRLISELRPMALDEQGIVGAIEYLAAEMENRTELRVSVGCDLAGDINILDWSSNIFRIVEEALVNVEQHSLASEATVDMSVVGGQFVVVIGDNGVGFESATAAHKRGLWRMHERASLFGGTVQVDSVVGRGTSVSVRVPLPV